uniref:DUF8207 domain-containing protein n=1 Tax=Cacopsylla melanoneura TaxID=428564 RepID=A0A8D8U0G7_9HEMI
MQSSTLKKQKELVQKIKIAQREIRKKSLALKLNQSEIEADIERRLKPVVSPLEKLLDLKSKKTDENFQNETPMKTPRMRSIISKRKNVEQISKIKHPEQSVILQTPEWDPFQTQYTDPNLFEETLVSPDEMFDKTIPEHPTTKDYEEKETEQRRQSASNLDNYINMLRRNDPKIDKASGVLFKNNRYELNRIPIQFDYYNKYRAIKIGNSHVKLTPGINELLFMKQPNEDLITQLDLRNYKKIAELCAFTGEKKLKTLKLQRYLGMGLLKRDNCKKKEYIYWNDPNELVLRLQLLHASKIAGHSGHDNEIISIEEELREQGIIK